MAGVVQLINGIQVHLPGQHPRIGADVILCPQLLAGGIISAEAIAPCRFSGQLIYLVGVSHIALPGMLGPNHNAQLPATLGIFTDVERGAADLHMVFVQCFHGRIHFPSIEKAQMQFFAGRQTEQFVILTVSGHCTGYRSYTTSRLVVGCDSSLPSAS